MRQSSRERAPIGAARLLAPGPEAPAAGPRAPAAAGPGAPAAAGPGAPDFVFCLFVLVRLLFGLLVGLVGSGNVGLLYTSIGVSEAVFRPG